MIVQLLLLLIRLFALTYSQSSTIDKACGVLDSTCSAGQTCVNGRCQCDPNQRRFWAGDQFQCRVCPTSYQRLPNRCYKYYSTPKNHSAAREDCRKDQADLFSWRNNDDETELITASTENSQAVKYQTYSWGGGIIYQGRGTKAEYEITWFDMKAPKMRHPDFQDPYVDRYCNNMMLSNYQGNPEPTRQKKNGETENCVAFVFVPRLPSRGQICMADDYCSTKMSYICELTESTIAGIYQTAPTPTTDSVDSTNDNQGTDETPAALSANPSSNLGIYVIVFIIICVILGVVAFIIIRKRKQPNVTTELTPTNSIANSTASDSQMYANP